MDGPPETRLKTLMHRSVYYYRCHLLPPLSFKPLYTTHHILIVNVSQLTPDTTAIDLFPSVFLEVNTLEIYICFKYSTYSINADTVLQEK